MLLKLNIYQPEFYSKITIQNLSQAPINQKVQIIGQIKEISDERITIDDKTGQTSLFIGKIEMINKNKLKTGNIIRIFGIWNGIELKIDKILEWNIPFDKLSLLS